MQVTTSNPGVTVLIRPEWWPYSSCCRAGTGRHRVIDDGDHTWLGRALDATRRSLTAMRGWFL
ncbi:hypothetical protein SAMN06265360_10653 [Haloechinothrix alba]|uniref:Uncharacterized protein n=1 Tax=Haloechinothrix alba TaxID=664784 RepID=A0A238WDG7_9PSEU|nr:hypothetical protein SAMN06265360_10653 [Haloechinothrix alba]